MTNKECCAEALYCKFVLTSTDFWKGVYESGLSPRQWLTELYLDHVYLEIEEHKYETILEQEKLQELCLSGPQLHGEYQVDACPNCGSLLYGEQGVDESILACINHCGYSKTL
jgi:hypothetical protein